MVKFIAKCIIRKQCKEYLQEFKQSQLAEQDEGFYTYVGDKHYFEFELRGWKLIFLGISDIVYFD